MAVYPAGVIPLNTQSTANDVGDAATADGADYNRHDAEIVAIEQDLFDCFTPLGAPGMAGVQDLIQFAFVKAINLGDVLPVGAPLVVSFPTDAYESLPLAPMHDEIGTPTRIDAPFTGLYTMTVQYAIAGLLAGDIVRVRVHKNGDYTDAGVVAEHRYQAIGGIINDSRTLTCHDFAFGPGPNFYECLIVHSGAAPGILDWCVFQAARLVG